MRNVLLAAAGVLVLGAVSIAIVAFVRPEAPRVSELPQVPADAEPVTAPLPPPRAPAPAVTHFDPAAAREAQALPPPPVIHDDPPPKPPEGSWEAVAVTARPSALGPLGAAVGRELNELEPKLSTCFDEDTQARHGQQQYTTVKDHGSRPQEYGSTTVLMLELETGYGSVRIVDAPVETRGAASDGLIACAQQVLRGYVIRVPGARAGARHRMTFELQH